MRSILSKATVILLQVLFVTSIASAQNLNDWAQKGPASSGGWVVSSDGLSVTQATRVEPAVSFFVSGKTYSDVELRYQVAVQTTRDDDHIGFVVGFKEPQMDVEADSIDTDFILIDWKQAQQSAAGFLAEEGMAISAFDGRFSSTSTSNGGNWPFWHHIPEPGFDTLATAFGNGFGWEDNVVYDVIINYTPGSITVDVEGGTGAYQNGLRVFDVAGTFEAGSVGFYTYSQEDVLFSVEDIIAVSIEDPDRGIPREASIVENYPNPFHERTTVSYTLPSATAVRINIYNTLGQHVANLVEGQYPPGKYATEWDAAGLPNGLYMMVLETNESTVSKKIVVLK